MKLAADFRGRMLEGDVMAREVLDRARMQEADAVAAVTSSDAVNTVVGHVAQKVFNVANVAVRNYDPRRQPLQETFSFQVVSSSLWGAARFEELLTGEGLRSVLSTGNGEVKVYEFEIGSAWAGRSLSELAIGGDAVAIALTRHGAATVPTADTRLEAGDKLHLSATLNAARTFAESAGLTEG